MTPQEQRNKRFDEKLEAGEFDYYEDGKFCGVLKEPLKSHLTEEVHLAIEQVEKFVRDKQYDEGFSADFIDYDDLLSFLTTLKK